jgi:C-terminal processing protease CtpA/Prc
MSWRFCPSESLREPPLPLWPARALLGACAAASALVAGCSDDPIRYPPPSCDADSRKAFVADIMGDYYLWYDRVAPVDIASLASPEDVMRAMTYTELDHWSAMQQQAERREYYDEGRFQGLGYTLGVDAEGGLRISWVHEGSAAGRSGLDRGALIVAVNGLPIDDLSAFQLNEELSRDVVVHTVRELDGTVHDVQLEQGDVAITSVKYPTVIDTPQGPVGYLMFTTFVLPGEDELRAAFTQFRDRGVTQLVIDLRYNGGGLLRTAALLGSLIERSAAGRPLIVETYNDLHSDLNRERLMFETDEGIDASHVVFLTTGRTASASEQVINGLSPYLTVDVVGTTTLGKPVGADSWDYCDFTLAPITFHSLNANGEGEYYQGIQPACVVEDDLLHGLGDPSEAQLAAALRVLAGEPCVESKGRVPFGATRREAELPGRFPEAPGLF